MRTCTEPDDPVRDGCSQSVSRSMWRQPRSSVRVSTVIFVFTQNGKWCFTKDVLPNINCTQAATYITPGPRCLCTAITPLPATTQWSRLLLRDVICSERVTVHFKWGRNLFMVTLTFDLNIQTRPSEAPNAPSLWIWRKSVQQFPIYFINKTNKKVTDSAKNRTLRSSLCAVKMQYEHPF